MIAVIGLGNPGADYQQTRHNIGFLVIEALANHFGLNWDQDKYLKAQIAKYTGFWLVKPQTFMNESGRTVKELMRQQDLGEDQIWVVHDDADLPFGEIRVKKGGTSGGHNGINSIDELNGKNYWRIRIGVDRIANIDLSDYVLSPFSQSELKDVPAIIDQAVGFLVESLLEQKLETKNFNAKKETN